MPISPSSLNQVSLHLDAAAQYPSNTQRQGQVSESKNGRMDGQGFELAAPPQMPLPSTQHRAALNAVLHQLRETISETPAVVTAPAPSTVSHLPSVNSATQPEVTRPIERQQIFVLSGKKIAMYVAATVALSPLLAAGIVTAVSLIVARKVVSAPISWPLLASRLMGLNFNQTNLKHNKLLNALLGPATIDALLSPHKSKAALMLAVEMAAVGITAATLGVGGTAAYIALILTGLAYIHTMIPALSAFEIEAYENQIKNYFNNRNNNTNPQDNLQMA